MSNFDIFEDQENLHEKIGSVVGETKLNRLKTVPLVNKAIFDENSIGIQTGKPQKSSTSTTTAISAAFKQKNVFTVKDEAIGGKQKPQLSEVVEESSIINVTVEEAEWTSDHLETSAASFSYRTGKDAVAKDIIATPMSVEPSTPMSVDKSVMDAGPNKSLVRNDRDRFFECVEYQKDILQYLKQSETQKNLRARPDYMKKQPDINDSMRSILVDWMVEVSEEYRLHGETLFQAINYIDRFLSFMSVVRAKLQLVGTAAMFISSKYEEIYPPEIGEFVYITDDTYTKQQVLRMEKLLLKVLSFDLCAPSPLSFINLFSCMMNIPEKVVYLARYFCELSLLRAIPFLNYNPSQLTSGALALAFYTLGSSIWSKKMNDTFGYELEELKEVIVNLSAIHVEAESMPQQAIQDKYKSNKNFQVSLIEPKPITAEELAEMISKIDGSDELNTTAENIENVRQKTEMLFN